MTTDRGYEGIAEMQLSNNILPVTSSASGATSSSPTLTTKSPGLNPNANVFHAKSPTTPPLDSGSSTMVDWPPTPEPDNVVLPPATSDLVLINGEDGEKAGSSTEDDGVTVATTTANSMATTTFPPTPESPLTVSQPDFTAMNGSLEAQVLFPASVDPSLDENHPLDGNVPDDQLRALLKNQLEYYFSRQNLANDSYLVSQMDADQYVSITTIASFNQIKRLTGNLDLITTVLQESGHVQVAETGDKVRPLHNRCIVILREIPDTTPVEAVQKLFYGINCPPFISCEFAHNDNWYVTFDTEEDAQKAYRFLREEVGSFLGKPIMARIKAKPLIRSSFVPKNGFKQTTYDPGVYSQPQKYPQYPTVPNVSYIPSQQMGSSNFPFFPPTAATPATPTPVTISPVWPSPGHTLPFFDPGQASATTVNTSASPTTYSQLPFLQVSAFAANGYTANGYTASPVKVQQTASRHGFQSMRNNRNQKPHRSTGVPSREQGNQPDRDRSLEQDQTERDSHDHPGALMRDHPHPRGDRSSYHDRHLGKAGGPRSDSHSSPGSATHHSQYHGPAASSTPRGHHHHHHHAHGGSGSLHGAAHPGAMHSHQSHMHGPHSHGHTHSHSHTHQQHSHSSHVAGERDRDSYSAGLNSGSRHSSLSDISTKDQFAQPQAPRRGAYRGRRRPRGSEDNGANRSGSSVQSAKDKLQTEPPNFDLEDTSFPPLPGSTNHTSSNEVFENKMSDVVRGTAKSLSRETTKSSSGPTPSCSPGVSTTAAVTTATGSTPSNSQSSEKPATSVKTFSQAATQSARPMSTSAAAVVVASVSQASVSQASCQATPATAAATTATGNAKGAVSAAATPTTPPESPQKCVSTIHRVSKSTSTETSPTPTALPHTSVPDSANVSTQTSSTSAATDTAAATTTVSVSTSACPGGATPAAAATAAAGATDDKADDTTASPPNEESKTQKKLSYAEMAQRGKEKVAVEKIKQEEGASKECSTATASTSTSTSSSSATAAASTNSPPGGATRDSHVSATVSATGSAVVTKSPAHEPQRPHHRHGWDNQRRGDWKSRDDWKPRENERDSNRGGAYFRERERVERRVPREFEWSRGK